MSRLHPVGLLRPLCMAAFCLVIGVPAPAQDAPPAYLSLVEGVVMLERDGESEPAVREMPFVQGDRLRTESGRVEIQFPDGTAIEVGEYSLVEAVTASRVRLLAGTMDHIQGRMADKMAMSAAYLPQDLQPYGSTFDQYGSWQYSAPHGYVWYPAVAPGWRPYYNGSWSAVPSYGWTWIGIDAWSWPTHHYGRWGYGRNAWYWIPGRTWGPAWVSWAATSDYVSWCPLGYDGRPVFALSVLGSDVGVRYRDHGWNGWTVMSRGHFGARGAYAHRNVVEPRQLPSNTPFIAQSRPPAASPHQSSGGSRQSAVGSRQSPVGSRQSAVGSSQSPVGSRQPPVGSRQSTAGSSHTVVAVPRDAGVAVPRYRPSERGLTPGDQRRTTNGEPSTPVNDQRRTTADYAVPRRAYPVAAPRVSETPRTPLPEQPRMYPQAVPRGIERPGVPSSTVPVYRPATPSYVNPGAAAAAGTPARAPAAGYQPLVPQRWTPRPTATPPGSAAPIGQASSPSHAAPPAGSAPPGAASIAAPAPGAPGGTPREGTARPRSGGDVAPAGARRPR